MAGASAQYLNLSVHTKALFSTKSCILRRQTQLQMVFLVTHGPNLLVCCPQKMICSMPSDFNERAKKKADHKSDKSAPNLTLSMVHFTLQLWLTTEQDLNPVPQYLYSSPSISDQIKQDEQTRSMQGSCKMHTKFVRKTCYKAQPNRRNTGHSTKNNTVLTTKWRLQLGSGTHSKCRTRQISALQCNKVWKILYGHAKNKARVSRNEHILQNVALLSIISFRVHFTHNRNS